MKVKKIKQLVAKVLVQYEHLRLKVKRIVFQNQGDLREYIAHKIYLLRV